MLHEEGIVFLGTLIAFNSWLYPTFLYKNHLLAQDLEYHPQDGTASVSLVSLQFQGKSSQVQ